MYSRGVHGSGSTNRTTSGSSAAASGQSGTDAKSRLASKDKHHGKKDIVTLASSALAPDQQQG